ncbi:unnamed protein product [Lymnaea stagnalis]|uniref:Kazal-like domain-containing protein n=1 Tax=Lymnaea stagnalis TaxID=6523 RepID=A0AAV2ICB0_LYMST
MALKCLICIFLIGLVLSVTLAQVTTTPCRLACPFNYMPVCGSNDVTYPNQCVLESTSCLEDLGLTLKHTGACL